MTVKTRRRVARKARLACGGYCRRIQPGEVYLEHTEFPGGDAGYADAAGHPVRMAECADCARRYGRGPLLADPVTAITEE
ncbi:hypothetical protein O4215_20440 [Rhodococcus maanshanensis]|uniref:hypothetical protein n=1 Tax=Rhodococcus maanshanensis TaxID=183556 RepID=UPI0022B3757D|nr:hypothetical protein [Rhodococcus maanshanensis]MCZ4557933.1 hypothetical protein [Rhodococcus maanshanensis]